jgi:mycothiol system anti-sigma-R factor
VKEHCRETLQRAYLFLDKEALGEAERREIQMHLEECRPCFERVGLEREITMIVARLKNAHPCPRELKARIASQLEKF